MRKFYFLLVSILFSVIVSAQVSVTATLGTTGPTPYTTVSDAFAAINAGTHQGDVTITITANTTEPSAPTALLKSAAPSSYTSVLIKPSGDVTINSAATPTTNRGIIELAGADNVTIDGDDPVTAGTRNLTIQVATSTNITAAIRVSSNSTTGADGADNNTVKNCIIIGSRNSATSTTVSYGINMSNYSTSSLSTGGYSSINNTFENNLVTRAYHGIWAGGTSSTYVNSGLKILNNTIGDPTSANNIGFRGILISYSATETVGTAAVVRGNDIRVGDYGSTGYSSTIAGIEIGTVNANALVERNNIHDINQPSTSGYGAHGIYITGSANNSGITIASNFIRDCKMVVYQTSATSTFIPCGVFFTAGATNVNFVNNTVVMNSQLGTGSNFSSFCVNSSVSTVRFAKFLNNILVNNHASTSGYGFYTANTANISGGVIDNNDYYCPSANVGYYNAAARNTLSAWQTATSKDGSSLSINPTFVSTTDLHLNYGTTPTQLESGGAAVATTGISTDFDGQARPGPTGSVNGGASAPDLGADEFDGVPLDLTPPSISYSPLNFTCAAGNRTLSATITDASGVPTSGAGLPVLYWNINGGAYNAATGSHVSGSTYSFVFGAGAVLGDVVNYYIAAQDNAPTPNVGTFPIAGSAGYTTNPPAAATAPTTPSSYSIANTLNGIYTVGATGTYPTLTAALAAYNSSCLSGPVEFSLIDPLYSTSETFPLSINQNPDASATNTLTIRPAAGVTTSITGSVPSNGLIRILGSHVIIDGSNNGSGFQNLSIQNTNTTSPRVILAGSATAAPLVNVTLKNFYALNGSKTSTSALAIQVSNSVGAAGNFNNILVENISVSTSYMGIYALANVATGNGSGLIIRNNGLDVSGPTSINYTGIYVQGTDGALVTGNRIGNFDGTTSQTDMGIWLATGTVNTVIEKNTIYNLVYTGTAGYNARGIYLSTGVTGSNNLIKNNMIYNMGGDGDDFATFGNQYNPTGIYLAGSTPQTGVEISNNTIFLSGNYINGTGTFVNGIALDDNSAASIRNNIIVNTSGTAGTGVGPVGIAAENSIAQFTALSNNAYNIATAGTGTNNIGKVGSTNYATLADFQAATSADANSKVTVPVFVSSTDLHLSTALGNNICLNGAATPLANVTDDFDGNPRDASTPDIGADEFALTIPTFLVANQSACFGGSVDLTAASVTAGSTAGQTFGYFTDAACTNAIATPAAVTTAGTYYIKATYTSGGCSIEQISPVTVTINALPTVAVSVAETSGTTANDGTICVGGSATLTASGATTYTWAPGGQTTDAITVSPTTTTTYTVTGTDANGCQNTATTTITVNALPTPSITVAETSGLTNNDGTICAGASASLTAAGGSSYSWSSGEITAAITVSPAVTTTYTVTATDANGCQATASSTITVDALPTVYNVTGGGAYCSGGVGSAIGLSGSQVGVNYELYIGGTATGNVVSGTGSAISFGTITTVGTYTVVASSPATGCISNMSGNATVAVNDLPVISYTLTQPNNCNSNNGGADLTITGAAGPYSYNWTGLGIIPDVQDQTTLRVGSYTVVVTAGNGCQATANFTLFGPGGCDICPTIGAVTASSTTVCQTDNISVNATGLADLGISYGIEFKYSTTALANPYTGGTSIAIVDNASLTGGGTGASASASFPTAGTYYVYAVLYPAPADPGCRPSQSVTVTVNANPTFTLGANPVVCSGTTSTPLTYTGTNLTLTLPTNLRYEQTGTPGTGIISQVEPFTLATNTSESADEFVVPAGQNWQISRVKVNIAYSTSPAYLNVRFYSNNGTLPGTLFASRDNVTTFTSAAGPNGGFDFTIDLPTDVSLPGGNTYWLVVQAAPTGATGFYWNSDVAATGHIGNPAAFRNPGQGFGITCAANWTDIPSCLQPGVTWNLLFSLTGSSVNGSTYNLTWSAAALAQGFTNQVGASLPDGAINLSIPIGAAAGTYSGTVAVTNANGCSSTVQNFTVTVVPTPTVNTVAPVVACNVATVNVPFTGFVPGTVYEWTNNNTAIGLAATGTGDLSFTGTNTGTTPITANIVVLPKYTGSGITCTGTPISFSITINPTPTVNAVSNQVVCNSGATTAVSFSGAVTGTTYSWTNSAPSIGLAASGTGDIASFTAVNTGTAPVTATITVTPNYTNGGTTCSGTATTFTITVNPQGQVNTVSNQTICNGANTTAVNFSTNNTGVTTTYSWTNSNTSIGLAASGSGNIPSFAAVNTGTTPVTATVTVTPSFTIPGGSGGFTPVTIPSPVSFNVYDRITTYTGVSVNGGGNAATVTPGSTVTLSYNYSVAYPGGFCPGCIVQNHVGLGGSNQTLNCVNVITNGSNGSRSLTFTAPTTPGIYYIQHGTTLEFSCIPLNYSNNPAGGGAYGDGAAIASIVVPDVTTCTGTPTTFTYTVNPTPTVNAVSSEVVCNNASTSAVTFSGAVTGTVYNWTNSNTAIGLAASGTGNIASFTATNSTNAPITATITVTPSYTNGGVTCTGTSTSYTITVNPTPTANTVSNQTLCNGAATTAVAFSGAVTGTVYTWTNNNTSIGLGASGTGNIASFTATNSTNAPVTATITVTPSFLNGGTLCTGTPTTFTITVNPTPNAVATPAAQTICSANAITGIVLTGNVTGTTYSWTRDNTTAVTGIAASGTGNITGTLTNTTNAPVTVTFTITPSANGCTGTPITATVLVNPTPNAVATPAAQTICSGSAITTIALTGNVAGTTYSWTRDNTTAVTGIAASGTGNITGTLTNTTTAPVTVTFTITPSANGCTGAPITATVIVNPIPTVNAVSNQVVCNRSATTAVAFTGAVTGTVYSWTNNTPSIGLAASGTGNIAAFTAVNTTQVPVVATITVTPSFTNGGVTCTGTPRTFTITVNPTPIVTATDLFNQRICISDAPVALNATPVGGSWSGIGVSGFNFVPSAAAVGNFVLTYTYTNQFGCTSTDTTTAKVLACDERNRSLEAGGAILYPNPNGGQFNVRVNSTRFQFLQMRIYNALGQLVSTKQWNGLTYGQILPVDMRHLAAGVYTVRVIYDGGNLYEDRGYQMLITH